MLSQAKPIGSSQAKAEKPEPATIVFQALAEKTKNYLLFLYPFQSLDNIHVLPEFKSSCKCFFGFI